MAKWPHLNRSKDKCTRVSVPSKKCAGTHNLLIYFNPSCLSLPPPNVICGIMTLLSSILSTHPMVDCSHVGLTQALSFESGTRRPVNSLASSQHSDPLTSAFPWRQAHRSFASLGKHNRLCLYRVVKWSSSFLRLHALIFIDYLIYA